MTLNREDYPDLTDEQWEKIQAEFDRRATQASETARKKAEREAREAAEKDLSKRVESAVEAERAKMEADEQGKIEIMRKEVVEAQAALAADRKSLVATKKLAGAGLNEEVVEGLLPMFVNVPDDSLEATLTTFIKTYQDGVKNQVDSEKQKLLEGATPPISPTGAPVDSNTRVTQLIEAGDPVGAIDSLLKQAGTPAS